MGFVYHGKFDDIAIVSFLSSGKNLNAGVQVQEFPGIADVTPWNFEDPPKLEVDDDDFDLDEFLAED